MRDLLSSAGVPRHKITVIHNAIDPDEYDLAAPHNALRKEWGFEDDMVVVGVVSRLSPEKGHALFVEAFGAVVAAIPAVRAIFVGDGPSTEPLKKLVASRDLNGYVRFGGYQHSVSKVYASVDLVVIPSLSEGLPFVLLEGWLHRKCVVATAVGGIPEVMTGELKQCLVAPGCVRGLANTIKAMVLDAQQRHAMAIAGYTRVTSCFLAPERVQRVIAVYEDLVAGEKRRVIRRVMHGSRAEI
jgi:glycosyltransferase involved in cell wall biosynthesis